MRRVVGAVAIAVAAFGACGTGGSGVSDGATATLAPQVAQIRLAAAQHDAGALSAALAALRSAVATLRADNQLSESAASEILADADGVERQVALITTTTSTPPPASPTAVTAKGHDPKPSDKKGHGKND